MFTIGSNVTGKGFCHTGSEVTVSEYTVGVTLCLVVVGVVITQTRSCGYRKLPGPFGWPIVGNIYRLGTSPHLTLTRFAETYGSVFRLRLGLWDTVVINGYDAVWAALVTNGDAFASRPPFDSYSYYSNGHSMSFCPYGSVLKQHRKMTARIIKDLTNKPEITEIIHREAMNLRMKWSVGGSMAETGSDIVIAVGSILYSVCFGADHRLVDNLDLCALLLADNPGTELFGAGNQTDFVPWTRYVTQRSAYNENIERMKRLVSINDVIIRQCHHDHEENQGQSVVDCLSDTAMTYGTDRGDNIRRSLLSRDRLNNTTVEFLSAGTETSSATLQWLLLYMAKYPDIQEYAHSEITDAIGCDLLPVSPDRYRLPFTQACILEVMRINTIVPFALPHYTTRDAQVQGHHVTKDTVVWVNLWSVNRDRSVWGDPDTFRPQRFLCGSSINRQMAAKCLPFSIGRRRCIGEQLGRLQVFVLFVSILQKFKVTCSHPDVLNLDAKFGDILTPKSFNIDILER